MGKELDIEKKMNLRRLEGNSKTSATLKGLGCSSAGMASDRHAADTGSIPLCGKGFFFLPESTFSADSLTVSVSPRVQSHAFTSVRTLKIP